MRWVLGVAFVLVACGARSDLSGTPNASPEAGTPVAPSGVVRCKPGDPMKELASRDSTDVTYALATDGTWLYEDFGSAFGSVSTNGGSIAMLTSSQTYLAATWADGVYFVGHGLEWIRHDGTGRHVVLPTAGLVVPPVMYTFTTSGETMVTEYSLADGSTRQLADVPMFDAWYGTAVTDRYLHVLVMQFVDMFKERFVDQRIDRVDGSFHDVELMTWESGPGVCDLSGVAPNAACAGELCALDERDDVVTLPVPHACPLLIDDEWAYYSLPDGFSRAGLRTGKLELLIPNVSVHAAAEANGCVYVEATFTAPGSKLVRIPR